MSTPDDFKDFEDLVRGGPVTEASAIDELSIFTRTYNVLKNEGITTVGDLISHTRAELMRFEQFGKVSCDQLEAELERHGLHLDGWAPPPPSYREKKIADFAQWWVQNDGVLGEPSVTRRDVALAAYLAGARV